MKDTPIWLLSAFLVLATSENARARVPVCEERPTFVEGRHFETFEFSRLPQRVMVARSVEVWAENKQRGLKLLVRHNFKNMKSDVRCSKAPYEGSVNLNAWVPALLDLSRERTWGDSLWQVHLFSESKRVGIWSQKTRLAPIEEARKILQKGSWRFLESEAYELFWDQEIQGSRLFFRVVFDVMNP